MKRFSVLLLALILLAGSFAGCAKKKTPETPGTTAPTATTETVYPYEEPEDYAAEFRILAATVSTEGGRYFSEYLGDAEGDKVDSAIFRRDSGIKDKFNVDIVLTRTTDWNTNLEKAYMSEQKETMFHIATPGISNAVYSVSRGMLADLDSFGFDFSKPWWNADAIDQMEVVHSHVLAIGNLNLLSYDSVGVIFFNKNMARAYGFTDLYDQVNDGKWTYEKMLEYVRAVTSETSGNGVMGAGDTYGLVGASYSALCFTYAGNFCFVLKDEDGAPYLRQDRQLFDEFFEKIVNTHDDENLIGYGFLADDPNIFSESRLLFQVDMLGTSRLLLDGPVEYGILPLPKWNETQKDYWTFPHQSASSVICCPIQNTEKEMTRRIVEDLAHSSRDTVLSQYIEVNLYFRQLNGDLDSYNTVLNLLAHLNCDIFFSYRAGITERLRVCLDNGDAAIEDQFRRYDAPFKTQLEGIVSGIMESKEE